MPQNDGASQSYKSLTLVQNLHYGSKVQVMLGNITDMGGMGAFLSTDEEMKWDKDNGCVYKAYTMSKMSE